jgi:alcohol dehydrogenase class IV
MSLAALLSGLSLANAGLGVVHGFAGPIGGMFSAPHGAVCAALLPYGMEANIRALRARAPESDRLHRFAEVARTLTGRANACAEDGVEWVSGLCRELQIPALATYGIAGRDIPVLIEKAAKASSMKANPIPLTPPELEAVLAKAL